MEKEKMKTHTITANEEKKDYLNYDYCTIVEALDDDEQLKKEVLDFLFRTGTNFEEIIYGAIGLGHYLIQCLYPGNELSEYDRYKQVEFQFRNHWNDQLNEHEEMTTIIDSALKRIENRIESGKVYFEN